MLKKIETALKDFMHRVGTEVEETKEAGAIIRKHLAGEKLTADENRALKAQLADILKGIN